MVDDQTDDDASAAPLSMLPASTPAQRTLRIATLNVHGWHNEEGGSWQSLLKLLCTREGGPPDVLALQEATKHRVPDLAHALGDYHWIAWRNCAILSKLPIGASMPGIFSGRGLGASVGSGGKHLSTSNKQGKHTCQMRHCAGVVTCADGTLIEIVCLHLDHVREPTRLGQLRALVEELNDRPHMPALAQRVLLGDFNALTRSDYSPSEWTQIANIRANNAWEAPVSEITDVMVRRPTKKAPLGLQMHDAWASVHPSKRIGPRSTCRFDTRIDYIFTTPRLAQALVGVECAVAIPHASDHNLVIAAFDLATQHKVGEPSETVNVTKVNKRQ